MLQKLLVLLCCSICFLFHTTAQQISDITISVENKNLLIQYKATGVLSGSKFRVRLFSSLDGFLNPLTSNVSGDVGDELPLQTTNKIYVSNPLVTLGNLNESIEFKIEATLIYSPVILDANSKNFSQKRGKSAELKWKGGLQSDEVNFDLLKNNVVIQKGIYALPANTGKAKVPIDKKLKLGSGYQIQMQVSSIEDNFIFPEMKLKRKFSLFGRVFWTVAALSAADYYLNPNSFIKYEILGFRDPLPEAPSVPSN